MRDDDPFAAAGWAGFAIIAVLLILIGPAFCSDRAHAQETSSGAVRFDCSELANAVADFADFRDTGADLDRVIAHLRESVKTSAAAAPERFEVIEREIRRLWIEGLPRREAAFQLFKRCKAQLGDMGRSA